MSIYLLVAHSLACASHVHPTRWNLGDDVYQNINIQVTRMESSHRMAFIQDPEGFPQEYTYLGEFSSRGDDTHLVPPNSIILFIHLGGVAH